MSANIIRRAEQERQQRKKRMQAMQAAAHSSGNQEASSSPDPEAGEIENMIHITGQPLDFNLVDNESSLKNVLKLYDNMYWIFSEKGHFPSSEFEERFNPSRFLGKAWKGEGRIPREHILDTGCIDWCVGFAFGGANDLLGKISTSNNNQILVAALLLAVAGGKYIAPPEFDDDTATTIVVALLGLTTFIQLFNLAGYLAVSNLINEPYTPAASMYARVEVDFYMKFLGYTVYLGVATFVAALVFVAWEGSAIDLYIIGPVVVFLLGFFCYILYTTTDASVELRRETVFQFYESFCESDGRLTQKYFDLAYADFESQLSANEANDKALDTKDDKLAGSGGAEVTVQES